MKKNALFSWTLWGPIFVIIGAALWGTETYFRVNLNTRFDSEVLVFYEHLFCILFTLPLGILSWREAKGTPRSAWIYLFLSGSVGSALGTTFFTLSLKELNISVANVLLNFQPIVSIIFARVLLREKLGKGFFAWGLLALAFGGVIAARDFSLENLSLNIGFLYIAITAGAWGFSTVAGRGTMLGMPLRVATAGRFIIGAVVLFISLGLKGKLNSVTMNASALTEPFVINNFLWLSFVAGVIPLYFYFKGLSKTSASVGGFCELTQTFSALLLTWGIMKQALSLTQVLAGIGLLFTVYQINLNFSKANPTSRV